MNFNEIKKSIKGNIVPVPGQFNDDLSMNLPAYTEHVQFLLNHDVSVFYLALSASEFDYMTSEERVSVTKTVADAVGNKGTILSQSVGGGWIDEQIDEAKRMMDAGATAIVVKPAGIKEGGKFFSCKYQRGSYSPERHDDYFVHYVEQFAEKTGAPLVYHDKPFSGGTGISYEGLQRIIEIDNVVCIKVHVPDPCIMQTIYQDFGDKIASYDGFGKTKQFWSLIWGASGRHTCWSWFDPANDQKFYDSVKNGDYAQAISLINWERPVVAAVRQTGFAGYKEIMRLVGVPAGPVRIPGEELSIPQKKMIKTAVEKIGLINR